ncbi:unnamed protein product [Calypogeia fissa]
MSANSANGACPSTPEPGRQEMDTKKQQQQEKTSQDKKAEQEAGKPNESKRPGQGKSETGKDNNVDGKRKITLQDLIDFTNESP